MMILKASHIDRKRKRFHMETLKEQKDTSRRIPQSAQNLTDNRRNKVKRVAERYVRRSSYEFAKRMLGTAHKSKFEDGSD